MNLYRIEYRAGWHDASMPLITWCFVIADDPTAAQLKLQEQKQIHPDNMLKITKEVLIP